MNLNFEFAGELTPIHVQNNLVSESGWYIREFTPAYGVNGMEFRLTAILEGPYPDYQINELKNHFRSNYPSMTGGRSYDLAWIDISDTITQSQIFAEGIVPAIIPPAGDIFPGPEPIDPTESYRRKFIEYWNRAEAEGWTVDSIGTVNYISPPRGSEYEQWGQMPIQFTIENQQYQVPHYFFNIYH